MRYLFRGFLLLFVLSFLFTVPVFASEKSWEISDFSTEIEVKTDGVVHIEDTLTYDFVGSFSYITRTIHHDGFSFLDNVAVLDSKGQRLDRSLFTVEVSDAETVIRVDIDVADRLYVQTFAYDIHDGLRATEDFYELYWDVTGNETVVPIRSVQTTVVLPEPTQEALLKTTSFIGVVGSIVAGNASSYDSKKGVVTFADRNFDAYEGQTIVIGMPYSLFDPVGFLNFSANANDVEFFIDDVLAKTIDQTLLGSAVSVGSHTVRAEKTGYAPSEKRLVSVKEGAVLDVVFELEQKLWYRLLVAGIIIVCLGGPIMAIVIALKAWRKHGKSLPLPGTIVAQYDAPKGFDVFMAGYLHSSYFRQRHFLAGIIALAEAGYVTIHEYEKKKYKLIRTNLAFKGEEVGGQLFSSLLGAMFGDAGESGQEFKLDSSVLVAEFQAMARVGVPTLMSDEGYYERNVKQYRPYKPFLFSGLLLIVLGIFTAIYVIGIGLLVAGIILVITSFFLVRRSKKGVQAYWHLLGLREYLHTAERFRMEDVEPRDFTKLLPYAIAFGVADQWEKRFGDALIDYSPDWYSSSVSHGFAWYAISSSLSSSVSSAASSPSSSGSGFSGGFSGGGGGGGGAGAG